jgi:hypothetical protein
VCGTPNWGCNVRQRVIESDKDLVRQKVFSCNSLEKQALQKKTVPSRIFGLKSITCGGQWQTVYSKNSPSWQSLKNTVREAVNISTLIYQNHSHSLLVCHHNHTDLTISTWHNSCSCMYSQHLYRPVQHNWVSLKSYLLKQVDPLLAINTTIKHK